MQETQFVKVLVPTSAFGQVQAGDTIGQAVQDTRVYEEGSFAVAVEQFGPNIWIIQFDKGYRALVDRENIEFLDHAATVLEIPENRPQVSAPPIFEEYDFVQLLVEHDCGSGSPVPAGSLGVVVDTLGLIPDDECGVVFAYHIHFWGENGQNPHAIVGLPNHVRLLS